MTLRLSLHPSPIELEAFAAADSPRAARRIANHLAGCLRCQDELRALRALRVAAHQLPAPLMSVGLFDAVSRRIAEGELVLLPSGGESVASRRRMPLMKAVAMVTTVVVGLLVIAHRGRTLEAGETAGDLTMIAHAPSAPGTLAVTYRPSAVLLSFDSVVVQAKLFAAGRYFESTAGAYMLHRHDRLFTADLTLPPDAQLAILTIASPDGVRVDDNDGRAWEFVARDSANRPTFEGLRLQSARHGFDDWERSFAAAKEMVRYYPDQPAGVRAMLGSSLALAGPSNADSVIRTFRPLLDALQVRYASAGLSAEVMWELAMLGAAAQDTAISRYWLERMKREYPRSSSTVQLSVFAIFNQRMADTTRLRQLDKLWDETGGDAIQLTADAFKLAEKLKGDAAIERWGDRFATSPGWAASAAATYVRYDRLRAKGESLLRASLQQLPTISRTDWQASLHDPSRSPTAARGQWQLATLGDALLRDGNAAAARDTLRRAAALAWDANTIALVGDAALAAGDTTEAAQAYAWVVADRRTTSARADSLRARLGARATRPEFDAAVVDGQSILRAMALGSTYRHPVKTVPTFAELSGGRRALNDVPPSGFSVLAVVSRHCAPSISDLPALERLKNRFGPLGVSVIAVVEETPDSVTPREITRLGYTGTLGFDDRAEVSRALRQYGTPQYFVIEGGKTVRADSRHAGDLIALLDAMLGR